jgi:hypothetical protein
LIRSRLKILRRLHGLHELVERTHAVELERRVSEVWETEQAIDRQGTAARSALFDGRAALTLGDRMEWSLAEVRWELARWRCDGLERIRAQREALRAAAQEQYVASRVKSEQMRHVVDGVETRVAIEEDRRSQAAADDRYLSRRLWVEARHAFRDDLEMNGS